MTVPPQVLAGRLLAGAADILSSRGLAKGAVRDPSSGAVDIGGALQLASGVPWGRLSDDMGEAVATVPQARLAAFLDAWEAVDATVDGLEDWQDDPSTLVDDVVALMVRVAEALERRVVL